MSRKQEVQSLEMVNNNVLINLQPNKNSSWAKEVPSEDRCFYVPK